jgi:hypothetical protein
LVRTAVLGFLQDVAARDWEAAAQRLATDSPEAMARAIETAFATYVAARERFLLDPEGRSAAHTHIDEVGDTWTIAQVLIDPAEENDWEARFTLSLAMARAENRVMLVWEGLGPIASG